MDLRVEERPGVSLLAERLCDLAHPLGLVPGSNKDRILRLDDGKVMDTDGGDQSVGDDQVLGGVDPDMLTPDGVCIPALLQDSVECVEIPEVVPVGIECDNRCPPGLLHDPVVDGEGRGRTVCLIDRVLKRSCHIGCAGLALGEEEIGIEAEHAGVPEVTVGDIAAGGFGVGFLHKSIHDRPFPECFTRADIAVSGVGQGRPHAEDHEVIFCESLCPEEGLLERPV